MILVTGATVFIGSAFLKKLGASERRVRVLTRDTAKTKGVKGVEAVCGDILDPASLENAVKGADAVVHLAGLVSYTLPRRELFRINVEGTKNLLDACKAAGVRRFVFASSVSVYGRNKGPVDELAATRPFNHYGASKLAAEELVKGSGLEYVILRLAPVYGAGSPQWAKILKLLDGGFPVPDVKSRTHVLSVGNAAQALALTVKGPPGIYNIADVSPVGFTEFAETLVRLLGKRPKRLPLWVVSLGAFFRRLGPYLAVLVEERHYNITAAKMGLRYRPADDFDAGLKRMVSWYLRLKPAAAEGAAKGEAAAIKRKG